VDIELDEDLLSFRDALRAYIRDHRPDLPRPPGTRSPDAEDLPAYRVWCAGLFAAGFVGSDWPPQWGGTGRRDPLRDYVVDQELAAARVPRPVGAYSLVAGALLQHGTEEQKAHYLPRIRRYDDLWCQLFSEPEAGSDLASLRTKARRDDDHWVIDGQKVWTTHAHIADLGFLLARTDPDAPKHQGITGFIVDMRAPGLEVRPLRELTGSSDFNEVFFDGVRIPAANVIGNPGQGWEIARTALAHERGQSLREDSVADSARRLIAVAREVERDGHPALADGDVRRSIGRLLARATVSDLLGLQNVLREAAGIAGDTDAAVAKVVFTEANLEIASYGVSLQGAAGILDATDDAAWHEGRWQEAYLWARGFTISAGSNEIMRNLIAERGLGLPRDPQPTRG
jgi:alkylation response protein AidB-like acyl-CoA dehydrogenase